MLRSAGRLAKFAKQIPRQYYGTSENKMARQLTSIIERENNGYVALCPEVDVASQGATEDEAHSNLKEALDLFFESASTEEIRKRLHEEIYVTQFEVAVG